MLRLGTVQVSVLRPDDGIVHGTPEIRCKVMAVQMQSRGAAGLSQLTAHFRLTDLFACQKPRCCALILLQDRQQQMAGICLFAAQVPGKLHCTAQQSVRLMRKALVTAKAHFFPDAHLPAPC